MHKPFYASGFLYSLKTNQILLFQTPGKENEKTTLTTIGGEGKQKEDPQAAFQRIIKKLLNLDLKTKDIYPIYDYFQDDLKKDNFVFYAELKRKPAIGSSENIEPFPPCFSRSFFISSFIFSKFTETPEGMNFILMLTCPI